MFADAYAGDVNFRFDAHGGFLHIMLFSAFHAECHCATDTCHPIRLMRHAADADAIFLRC